MTELKFCKYCSLTKPLEAFARKTKEGRLHSVCKQCQWIKYGKDRVRDRIKCAAQARAWRARNRDHIRLYQREYHKRWAAANPDKIRSYRRNRSVALTLEMTSNQ